MDNIQKIDELFDPRVAYPNIDMKERLSNLVGMDEYKTDLGKILGILVNKKGLTEWSSKHHPNASGAVDRILHRPPLVVLAGDVGSGKTELATTIGDQVARTEDIKVTLYPLSLSARGQGAVGEMTRLISEAFQIVTDKAKQLKSDSGTAGGAVIMLIDEADALAQSREESQMHHEDRAGVNAFIRGIDRIANEAVPAAIIMCTNRLGALDPAIRRRSARVFEFFRPNQEQRKSVLRQPLSELGFSDEDIDKVVVVTGAKNKVKYGCTFSDLTQRFIPEIILDAYPDKPVTPARALAIAEKLIPTPPFGEA